MKILQINGSARSEAGNSTRIASDIVARLQAANPGATLVQRDLARDPAPVIDEAALGALFTPAEQRTPEQAARVALDDALIAQVQSADAIVLGVPMYNFGVPVQLKTWLDAIARAGVTFRYTETGPVGLVENTRALVVSPRGGMHVGNATDLVTPYMRTVLGFIGINEVDFIYAEGMGMGPEAQAKGIEQAKEQLETLAY